MLVSKPVTTKTEKVEVFGIVLCFVTSNIAKLLVLSANVDNIMWTFNDHTKKTPFDIHKIA